MKNWTKEEILEYNKRCAEFLEIVDNNEYIKFHTDWNWIMEVLNKISLLDFGWKVTSKYVNIYSHIGDPRGKFDCKFSTNCPENVMLDVVRTINQFLIWYNGQRT